ncbi:M3 family oligoendopeptidase [Vallitalea pronyensis]|uniref:M3 family oligoendopeptidase n=1 Tax=Vallitalea pronyensis TaxID=1348613 RepID=A0A8J8MN84_9FIRM|nr:M3 family oligoendopeptidase [Vallitalea pronyensis]QUI24348.1 M3 family oligoendopeptidase [Vallitalea pronyensis]
MNMRWNLDKLYTSFDSEALQSDFELLPKLIQGMNNFIESAFTSTDDAKEKLEKYLQMYTQIKALTEKLYSYGELIYSVDTTNMAALKQIEKVENYIPQLTIIESKFKKWLNSVDDLDYIIASSDLLNEYEFILNHEKNLAKYLLSDEEEALIAEMQNTGSNAWSKLQDTVTSSLLVDYEDEQLPLSVIRNYAYDASAEKRKTAYEAELKAYQKIEQSSSACLNSIKGEVITLAKKRGYASPLEMTLINSRMDQETLDAMMTAIKEYLPYFHQYMKKKAQLLGYKKGLPFYDLCAPIGNVDLRYSFEEAKVFVVDNFYTFSKKLGDYANHAFDNQWIDAEPRPGKVGGAFCDYLHMIKESRIMTNFSGSLSDITTLAHELGHGYHGACLNDESDLNSDYPMPIAETASIFCETIVANAAIKEASDDEALVILEADIMGSSQTIVDIYSRYLFETELFNRRKNASLSVDELKEIMENAQKEAYGEGLDPDYLHPYMWACKPHYYFSDANFYNFPYAFGLLFAKGLYAKYLEIGDAFIPKYDALLTATGKHNVVDVLAIMDIDAHNPDFWRSSLEMIKKDIDKFLAL